MRFDSRGLVSTYLSDWMPTGDTTRQSVAGYFAGGWNSTTLSISGIDKIAFPAETRTTLSATLTAASYYLAGMSNSGVAGYPSGGEADGYTNRIDRIAFPADTKTTLTATLTVAKLAHGGAGFADCGVL